MSSIPARTDHMGDVSWVIEARRSGKLPLLIVQGVLMTALAQAADVVLPGAAWVEKDGAYVNGQGRLQGGARVIDPPGDAQEDWQVFVNIGLALGAALDRTPSSAARSRRSRQRAGRQTSATPGSPNSRSRGRCRRSTGCRRRTRPSGGSGTSCSRTCRRSSSPVNRRRRRGSTACRSRRKPSNTATSERHDRCLKMSRSLPRSSRGFCRSCPRASCP